MVFLLGCFHFLLLSKPIPILLRLQNESAFPGESDELLTSEEDTSWFWNSWIGVLRKSRRVMNVPVRDYGKGGLTCRSFTDPLQELGMLPWRDEQYCSFQISTKLLWFLSLIWPLSSSSHKHIQTVNPFSFQYNQHVRVRLPWEQFEDSSVLLVL